MLFRKISSAAALSAALAVGAAQADTVSSQLFTGNQLFSDNSAEFLASDLNSNGLLDEGDRLRGIFTISTIEQGVSIHFLGAPSANNELAGIFDLTVATKVADGAQFDFTFTPTPVATSGFNAFGAAPGTAVILFEDATHEYTRIACATTAACEANVIDGTPFWYWGFKALLDAGEVQFWSANDASDSPAAVGAGTGGGSFNIGIHQLAGGAGPLLSTVVPPCADIVTGALGDVDVCANGNLLAKGVAGASSPYDVFDNVDISINVAAAVPEPGSIALLGIGLAGLAAVGRRRRGVAK